MQKSAIFGGTFNPVHCGHLQIAKTALDQGHLNRVIWVPTYQPPHKSKIDALSFTDRYEMVRLALAPYPDFVISTVERDQSGKSFAVHTLQALQLDYPNCQWYWILGLDAFRSLPHWYARQELAAHCCWLVAPRFEQTLAAHQVSNVTEFICADVEKTLATQSIPIRWQILNMQPIHLSSSLIRRYCQEQRPLDHLVPNSVRSYISARGLYRPQHP